MLTAERGLNTRWRYSHVVRDTGTTHRAEFEVLEVFAGKVGIFIYSQSISSGRGEPDLARLEDLDLDGLEELVHKKFVSEIPDEPEVTQADERDETFAWLTFIGALICFFMGVIVFACGLSVHRGQHAWEAAIGAAFVIAALMAVALRRD